MILQRRVRVVFCLLGDPRCTLDRHTSIPHWSCHCATISANTWDTESNRAKMSAEKTIELNGKAYPMLADGEYDCIILGTGLKECMLAGLLSKKGMKVSDDSAE